MLKACQTTPPRATVQDSLGWDGTEMSVRQSDCDVQVQDIPGGVPIRAHQASYLHHNVIYI